MLKVSESQDKAMRKARGVLNQALLPLKSREAFRTACLAFQKEHGREIWSTLTHHNDEETFSTLAQVHQERIDREEYLRSPAGIKDWIKALNRCTSDFVFKSFQDGFNSLDYLRDNQEVSDAIHQMGRRLGIPEYMDDDQ